MPNSTPSAKIPNRPIRLISPSKGLEKTKTEMISSGNDRQGEHDCLPQHYRAMVLWSERPERPLEVSRVDGLRGA